LQLFHNKTHLKPFGKTDCASPLMQSNSAKMCLKKWN